MCLIIMLPYVNIRNCKEYFKKYARKCDKKCNAQNITFNDLNATS